MNDQTMAASPFEQSRQAYERGRALFRSGDLLGAIAALEASVQTSPHFRALELLGKAWLLKGEPRKAVVPLAAATTLNKQVRAASLLAEAFLALGQQIEAYEIAALALQRDPGNNKALAVAAATEVAYRRWASQ